MSRDPADYIDHVRESMEYIETWTAEGRERFFGDMRTQAAVIRKLHELSESIKRLRAIVGDRYRPSIEAAHCAHRDRPSRLNVPE